MPPIQRLFVTALTSVGLLAGCASNGLQPLSGIQRPVDLPRFMGDWYLLAFIPIDLPFISEAGAHNGIESYQLEADGSIATTYTFRDGAFDGPEEVMRPRARVANPPINSEWKMKFFWFLPAGDFLIIYLDEDYQRTVIAVPDRRWVWLMARKPDIPAAEYQEMLDFVKAQGFDMGKLRQVPQRWPQDPQAAGLIPGGAGTPAPGPGSP